MIVGDANRFETGTFLKLGMTSLMLGALEAEQRTGTTILPRIELADPVAALHAISHDPTLTTAVPLADGSTMTGIEIQRAHAEAIRDHADLEDEETAQIIDLWTGLLDVLETDRDAAADRIEWVGKLALLEGYRARHGLAWDDPRLLAIDLQWTDLRPGSSLFDRLQRAGRTMRLVDDAEVARAVSTPPRSTRAHLRGTLARAHADAVPSAGWDVITLADETGGARIRLADPVLGSEQWCRDNGIDPHAPVERILADLHRAFTDKETS